MSLQANPTAAPRPESSLLHPNGRSPDATLSVVIPTYNEEQNVERMYRRLAAVLDGVGLSWEVIFSVDPCTDRTEELILGLRARDRRVKALRFSRRFGQPMATIAGLEAAVGEAVVVIDCDLQDPPELIAELVARWREGYDVVYAQRRSREGETLVKRIVAKVGYRVIARIAEIEIPPNTGDFRLLSRRVVDNVVALEEHHGFLRGLVALVGFRQTLVLYDRDRREAGTSKYNRFFGSILIGLNGVIGFSRYPLQLISLTGVALSGLAFLVRPCLPRHEAPRRFLPGRQPHGRDRHRLLQRHPAAVAGRDRRVRRAHLRRVPAQAQVHRRVPLRVGRGGPPARWLNVPGR